MTSRTWTQIFSDQPIVGEDGLAFEFDGLAKTIAELGWNPDNATPFTVVVRGDWGRGKTTLMRQAKRQFDEAKAGEDGARTVRTLWFNAWKCHSEETVLAGLLGALVDEMRAGSFSDQLGELLNRFRHILGSLSLSLIVDDVTAKPEANALSEAAQRRAFHDQFRQIFSQLLYVLQRGPSKAVRDLKGVNVEARLAAMSRKNILVVFLDDLDRCSEARVLEVLEGINLFMDLPGVCFCLGLDWGRLLKLLERTMPGREEEFLEKIVQISLDLPEISRPGVSDYLVKLTDGTHLADVLGQDKDVNLNTMASVLTRSNPRHVKRVLNDLSMTLGVLRNTGKIGITDNLLPESAVIAWHMLREALPAEEWLEVRAKRVNLDAVLDKWSRLDKSDNEGSNADASKNYAAEIGASDALQELHRSQDLDGPMRVLSRLTPTQRDVLVHFGSPPREPANVARRIARIDDLDLLGSGDAWVPLDGGEFQMGDAETDDAKPYKATLSPFRISRYPVTNEQYAAYVHATRARAPKHWSEAGFPEGTARHPVVNVSWDDAAAFCVWLSKERAEPENAVSLPSEAQWEFAARGLNGRTYPWGDVPEPDAERANFSGNVGGTTPVDRYGKGKTDEGVFDLAGNVLEWCADWYGPYPEHPMSDYGGLDRGDFRVLRGGAFLDLAHDLRAASRYSTHPTSRRQNVGFRVVWRLPGGQT